MSKVGAPSISRSTWINSLLASPSSSPPLLASSSPYTPPLTSSRRYVSHRLSFPLLPSPLRHFFLSDLASPSLFASHRLCSPSRLFIIVLGLLASVSLSAFSSPFGLFLPHFASPRLSVYLHLSPPSTPFLPFLAFPFFPRLLAILLAFIRLSISFRLASPFLASFVILFASSRLTVYLRLSSPFFASSPFFSSSVFFHPSSLHHLSSSRVNS